MAEASMKDIKLRIKSVESTRQITKAMELVASSKLRKAKERAEQSRPYFQVLTQVIADIAANGKGMESPYLTGRTVEKSCFIVIGGDRGLAGGYNHNVFALATSLMEEKNALVLPIGKRTLEFFQKQPVEILTEDFVEVADVGIGSCHEIAKLLTERFLKGAFDEVVVVYTRFESVLTQVPAAIQMLPLDADLYTLNTEESGGQKKHFVLYEPSSAAVFKAIVPDYLAGVLWSAVTESMASEFGARRTAMEAATKNATEMIDSLSLQYNRARQGAITQEITEIVAGSEN